MFCSSKIRSVVLLLLPLLFVALPQAARATPPAAEAVFALSASRDGDGALRLNWTVAPGTYLYRDSLKASLGGRDLPISLPAGEPKDDPNFGPVEVYHDAVGLTVAGLPPAGALDVAYQGCAEAGICYPPVHSRIDLASLTVTAQPRGLLDAEPPAAASPGEAALSPPLAAEAEAVLTGSILAIVPVFVGFGLLLAFTPCVFPMIPILSGILVGAAGPPSIWRGFSLSAAYVVAMAAAYGLAGLVAGWSGANLQALLQTPVVLILSAAVFVVLALAMFGLFELSLPAALVTRLASLPMRGGSLGGAALLGFGSALVIGPCVTPPLAAAMLYAIDTGDAARGGLALFSLGLGMGLPLVVAGTFGTRLLPKAGPWLAGFRRVFGLMFLAIAVMLATRLLPAPVGLALWALWSVAVATWLGAFERTDRASPWRARLGKASGLMAALYGAVLIVGAAGGGTDPLHPLAVFTERPATDTAALPLTSPGDFDRALAAEAPSGRPVLVVFTADWCTVCKSNEKVLAQPELRARLEKTARIFVDMTAQTTQAQDLMARFRVVGPPALFILDANGREVPGSRLIGAVSAADLAARLAT